MEHFLICGNPRCRYIINLREGTEVLERSKLVIDECPECGNQWSSYCPFCGRPLQVTWENEVPLCSHCTRTLKA